MVEFALNFAISSSSGFAPFELNYRYMPSINPGVVPEPSSVPRVKQFVLCAMRNLADAHNAIIESRVQQMHYANRHRRKDDPFMLGDLVYVSTADLSLPKGHASKLLPKYVGPFKILDAQLSTSTYKVDLRLISRHGTCTIDFTRVSSVHITPMTMCCSCTGKRICFMTLELLMIRSGLLRKLLLTNGTKASYHFKYIGISVIQLGNHTILAKICRHWTPIWISLALMTWQICLVGSYLANQLICEHVLHLMLIKIIEWSRLIQDNHDPFIYRLVVLSLFAPTQFLSWPGTACMPTQSSPQNDYSHFYQQATYPSMHPPFCSQQGQ